METLIEVLKESVRKNGEKPLTNKRLLNLLLLAEKIEMQDDDRDYPDIF